MTREKESSYSPIPASKGSIGDHLCYQLLQVLTPAEMKAYEFVTISDPEKLRTRDKLYFSLKTCIRQGKAPKKAVVFTEILDQTYSKKLDYKLRNEMRHLANDLRHFLTLRIVGQKLKSDEIDLSVHLIKDLRQRGEVQLGDKLEQQALRRATKRADLISRRELELQKLVFLTQNLKQEETLLNEVLALTEHAAQTIALDSAHALGRMNTIRVHAGYVLWTLNPSRKMPAPLPLPEALPDSFLRYNEQAILTYIRSGRERLAALLKSLEILPEVPVHIIDKQQVRAKLHNNIGLEYMLQKNFAEAIPHFRSAADPQLQADNAYRQIARMNLASSMLRAGRYAEASAELDQLTEEANHHPILQSILPKLHVWSLMHQEKWQAARRLIPQILDSGAQSDTYYLRLTLAILHTEIGEYELALREASNLETNLRMVKELDYLRTAAAWLRKYIILLQEPNATKQDRSRQRLQNELKAWFHENTSTHADSQPLQWLKKKIMD